MGLRKCAFLLISSSFLLSGLEACTTCVGSEDRRDSAQKTPQRATASAGSREQIKRHTLQVGGSTRHYLVQTPRTPEAGKQAPLMVLFPGAGQTPERFTDRKNITIGAAKLGYVLAVPASKGSFRDEFCGPFAAGTEDAGTREPAGAAQTKAAAGTATATGTVSAKAANAPMPRKPAPEAGAAADGSSPASPTNDDLQFVQTMIEQILKDYPVNPGRIYLLGVGSGAAFAEWVATQTPQRFSGVVSVASTSTCDRSAADKPAHPVTILMLDGQDPAGSAPGGSPAIAYWLQANQCPPVPGGTPPDADLACAAGSRLRHVTLPGLTDWPQKVSKKYTMRYVHEFFGGT